MSSTLLDEYGLAFGVLVDISFGEAREMKSKNLPEGVRASLALTYMNMDVALLQLADNNLPKKPVKCKMNPKMLYDDIGAMLEHEYQSYLEAAEKGDEYKPKIYFHALDDKREVIVGEAWHASQVKVEETMRFGTGIAAMPSSVIMRKRANITSPPGGHNRGDAKNDDGGFPITPPPLSKKPKNEPEQETELGKLDLKMSDYYCLRSSDNFHACISAVERLLRDANYQMEPLKGQVKTRLESLNAMGEEQAVDMLIYDAKGKEQVDFKIGKKPASVEEMNPKILQFVYNYLHRGKSKDPQLNTYIENWKNKWFNDAIEVPFPSFNPN